MGIGIAVSPKSPFIILLTAARIHDGIDASSIDSLLNRIMRAHNADIERRGYPASAPMLASIE